MASPIPSNAELKLRFSAEGRKETQAQVHFYLSLAKQLKKSLMDLGHTCWGGEDSPYIWWKTPQGATSWEFFDHLLHTCHLIAVPGVGFGKYGEGYIRLSGIFFRRKKSRWPSSAFEKRCDPCVLHLPLISANFFAKTTTLNSKGFSLRLKQHLLRSKGRRACWSGSILLPQNADTFLYIKQDMICGAKRKRLKKRRKSSPSSISPPNYSIHRRLRSRLTNTVVVASSTPPFSSALSLAQVSCVKPLAGGVLFLLKDHAQEIPGFPLPKKAGNALFFAPDFPLPWNRALLSSGLAVFIDCLCPEKKLLSAGAQRPAFPCLQKKGLCVQRPAQRRAASSRLRKKIK